MDKPATLYLMLGYPGAGKTTTANIITELTSAVKLSSDDIRTHMYKKPRFTQEEHDAVYGVLDHFTELLLSKGVSVIYDANLNRFQHRKEKYDICERTGAQAQLLWLQTSREFARERATLRGYHHLVPADETFETMFDRVADTIEPPRDSEPFVAIDGASVDEKKVRELLHL